MNNYGSFTKLLFGLNKTLRVAGQVIPLYRDSKPLIKGISSFIKKKNITVSKDKTPVINKENKKIITYKSNNPKFFI